MSLLAWWSRIPDDGAQRGAEDEGGPVIRSHSGLVRSCPSGTGRITVQATDIDIAVACSLSWPDTYHQRLREWRRERTPRFTRSVSMHYSAMYQIAPHPSPTWALGRSLVTLVYNVTFTAPDRSQQSAFMRPIAPCPPRFLRPRLGRRLDARSSALAPATAQASYPSAGSQVQITPRFLVWRSRRH